MNRIPIEDRLEIQDLVARYAVACDMKKYADVEHVFAEDSTFDESILGMPVTRGNKAIAKFFCATGESVDWLIHLNCNHHINAFDGHSASATSHLHAEGMLRGTAFRIYGYYADDYVKTAGRWYIKQRQLVAIAPLVGFGR
jgi:SnoaL-like domain